MNLLCGLQILRESSAPAREGALLQARKARGKLGVQGPQVHPPKRLHCRPQCLTLSLSIGAVHPVSLVAPPPLLSNPGTSYQHSPPLGHRR